ncbi:branched-chain amino acid transport system ATP-binding protein [Monaibacterium marinum]|uniref:Branched-chain amino acid transport system ATP-binding protein n=1 Tax=Pontivivens marinum TaxID=1690039 RepID=A0A2C9CUW1_9RHOB|nr:ABC transporter ATP-binding protein [Monaibacterium marinum]SOH95028.1 branched-chain amino acid transport system ATP-binding protein [Monaibacterium marinum]
MDEPVLSLREVSKTFGVLKASDGVSLDLRAGEIHALIGPNGAGKSTLIAQIAGSLRPDSGTIRFAGQDVTRLGPSARARRGLGRSFQISQVIAGFTVRQNILLAVQARAGRAYAMLRRAARDNDAMQQVTEYAQRVGLAERLDVEASDIAHGERRRLEIAMALAMRPKVFVLDEPMAGMGAEGVAVMTQLLDPLRHEAPILLVEHDMQAVFALADRISVLVYGRIIASGSVAEIRNDPEVRRAYLGDEA